MDEERQTEGVTGDEGTDRRTDGWKDGQTGRRADRKVERYEGSGGW